MVTCIGTLQHNRKGIQVHKKTVQHREVLSSKIYWEKEKNVMTISSYVVKTSTRKMNTLIFSTHERIEGVTKDNGKETGLYMVYDFTKGGTDILDQRKGFNTTKTKCRRWNITAFSYDLETNSLCECDDSFCHEQ